MILDLKNLTYNHVVFKNPKVNSDFKNHSHNVYELLFFIKGEASYVIENRKYDLKKNDLVFIRPNLYHYVQINSNAEYERINVSFDSSVVSRELLKKIPKEIEVVNCPPSSILSEIFGRMEYYSANLLDIEFADVLTSLLKEVFYALSLSSDGILNIPSEISPLLTKILKYLNDNLFTVSSIKEIADEFFVTEQYLHRIFQTQLKITPKKYINAKRLSHAQKLIQRGKKPVDVYSECGFETYVGFYKQYVNTFGYSPSKEKCLTDLKP
ncbi:MAG: helix-turn-helix transcriptional regulator [Clostridia bacterium]|nr:helix-turn-helix transcriptional regulator [Clostridia bacterium]